MSDKKKVRLDPTNAVITEATGEIIKNGVHQRCPHCGKALLHNRDAVNIWTVGATKEWQCCKCRKNYKSLTIPVPPSFTPEHFYETLLQAIANIIPKV